MTAATMSAPSHNFSAPSSRKPGSREHSPNAARRFDERVARTVLQMCMRKRAMHANPGPINYVPRMDLYDDESLPYITAMLELPGVVREDISVVVRDGKLIVAGQRRSPLASRLRAINTQNPSAAAGNTPSVTSVTADADTERGLDPAKYRFRELKFGQFHRAIEIPPATDTADVYAEMRDGMLLLSWPRGPAPVTTGREAYANANHDSHLHTTHAQNENERGSA